MLRHAVTAISRQSIGWSRGAGAGLSETQAFATEAAADTAAASGDKERAPFNIWLGNLPWKTTREQLSAAFEPYGGAKATLLMRDKATGRAKGMALVAVDPARVDEAIAQMNGKDFQGRLLKVARSTVVEKPRAAREAQQAQTSSP